MSKKTTNLDEPVVIAAYNSTKTQILITISANSGTMSSTPISNELFPFNAPSSNPATNKEVIRVREVVFRITDGTSPVNARLTYDLTNADTDTEVYSIAVQDDRSSPFLPKKPKALLIKP